MLVAPYAGWCAIAAASLAPPAPCDADDDDDEAAPAANLAAGGGDKEDALRPYRPTSPYHALAANIDVRAALGRCAAHPLLAAGRHS